MGSLIRKMKDKKILITSALPYSNGSIHIGHLVEYIQTDIIVRFFKQMGRNVVYCCADDTHGAPISIKAEQLGITPEKLITKAREEHIKDFSDFNIEFDSYYSTNSDENRYLVYEIFRRLKEKGFIYEKDINLPYCSKCKRFLPDRYVKGTCPECGAEDQYGDNCEVCGAIYKPIDLVDAKCSICGSHPKVKKTNHLFFKLSAFSGKLKDWLNTSNLQDSVKNQCLRWIDKGLEDWCISRDPPYFGFKIPDSDKYFYVWLDAPIGYMSSYSTLVGGAEKVLDAWNNSEIIHFIGKDIIYFHFLFWPAVLMAADINLPKRIFVHGFLKVNGAKMSKSRGTFLTAREVLGFLKPEHLRFYYASCLPSTITDLDLDFKVFKAKINNILVSNIANFFYRTMYFLKENFDGEFNDFVDKKVMGKINKKIDSILSSYDKFELTTALSEIIAISSIGNKYFQEKEPWKIVKNNKEEARNVLSFCLKISMIICSLLKPVMPEFCKKIEKQFNGNVYNIAKREFEVRGSKISKPEIIEKKIKDIKL